jgi:hypothetical protein
MYAGGVLTPGLHTHGDYLPLLAIEDGRLGEMVRQCRDEDWQVDALALLLGALYPHGCWVDRTPCRT